MVLIDEAAGDGQVVSEYPPQLNRPGSVQLADLPLLDRVTMHVFVRNPNAMIAAPVQRDIDGIAKGSHYVLLKRTNEN